MPEIDAVQLATKYTSRATGGPMRRTEVVIKADGSEERNQVWRNSRRRWSLVGAFRTPSDLLEFEEFYSARGGLERGFLWKDPVDNRSCSRVATPAATDQPLGTGDGSDTTFQLVKRYGGASYAYDRKISRPVAGTVLVAIDGTPTTAFTVDTTTGVVTMDAAPADGAALTSGFEYLVPVRFDADTLESDVQLIAAGSSVTASILEILE